MESCLPVDVEGQVGLLIRPRHHHTSLRDGDGHPDQLLVPLLGPVEDAPDGGAGLLLPAFRGHPLTPEVLDIELDSFD